MKKYKVLFSPDHLSVKEIDSYKDFNLLVKKHQVTLLYQRLLKAGVSALSVAGLVGAYVFFAPEAASVSEEIAAPAMELVQKEALPQGEPALAEPAALASAATPQPKPSLASVPQALQPEEEKVALAPENQVKANTPVAAAKGEESKKETLPHMASPEGEAAAPASAPAGEMGLFTKPEPPLGYPALQEFFAQELVHAEISPSDRTSGIVLVSFAINERGEAEDIKVEKSLSEACDAEAVRLIKRMPAWKPATVNGDPVKTRLALPVRF